MRPDLLDENRSPLLLPLSTGLPRTPSLTPNTALVHYKTIAESLTVNLIQYSLMYGWKYEYSRKEVLYSDILPLDHYLMNSVQP